MTEGDRKDVTVVVPPAGGNFGLATVSQAPKEKEAEGQEAGEKEIGTDVNRGYQVPTKGEPVSVIDCRDIDNWCNRCRKFKMPVFSEDNWAGVFLGLGVAFDASALAGTGGKHGWAIGLVGLFSLLVAFAFGSIAYSKRNKDEHDLSTLADEMEGAKTMNRVPEPKDA